MTVVHLRRAPDVLLVDGEHLAYRAFYVFSTLCTSAGDPSGVFYGILSMLRTQLERRAPGRIVLVWGSPGNGSNRKALYSEYKGTRSKRPDFQAQVLSVQRFLSYLNWDQYYTDSGWEADDVIATLARFYAQKGQHVAILSGDHDFLQLVNANVTCVVPGKSRVDTQFTPEKIWEVYGVEPQRLVDVFALCGETADNITGVPRVGETTAQQLVAKFGAVDTWLEKVREMDEITPTLRQSLWDNRDLVRRNKELIDLSLRDVELCAIVCGENTMAATGVLAEYEIKKFGVYDFTGK